MPQTLGDEELVWRVAIAPGHSTPCVVREHIFFTTFENEQLFTVALDRATGREHWRQRAPAERLESFHRTGSPAVATPACDGERVYVIFGSSVLAALGLDGKLVWRKEIVPFDFDVAIGTSPVLHGETIILQCDGVKKSSRLIAYDRKTGAVTWEQKRPQNEFSHSTPVVARIGDKDQLLVAASNALQGVDPSSGKVLWSCAGKGDTVSPVFGSGIVYCDSGRGGLAVAVDPSGTGDVTASLRKWTAQLPEGFSSPVIVGEYLYRLNNPGFLKCCKLASGEVVFNERLDGVATAPSPITTADGRIYLASSGKSYVVKAGPKLEVLAVNDLGDGSEASAAIAGGRLYFKGQKYLYCIGKK